MRKGMAPLLVMLLGLACWQAVTWAQVWPPYLFPAPVDVWVSTVRLVRSGELPFAFVMTLLRITGGFTVSALAGIGLGLALSQSQRLSEAVGPIVLGLQAMPSICWFPLAILWFGLNEGAIAFVTVVGALFCVAFATESAIRNIQPSFVRAGATMGASGVRLYTRVIFPAALPNLLTGLRSGWSFAWRSLMAAELLFMNLGLGHLLNLGRDLADASQVVAIILVILLVGLAVDRLVFARSERSVRRRWGFERAA